MEEKESWDTKDIQCTVRNWSRSRSKALPFNRQKGPTLLTPDLSLPVSRTERKTLPVLSQLNSCTFPNKSISSEALQLKRSSHHLPLSMCSTAFSHLLRMILSPLLAKSMLGTSTLCSPTRTGCWPPLNVLTQHVVNSTTTTGRQGVAVQVSRGWSLLLTPPQRNQGSPLLGSLSSPPSPPKTGTEWESRPQRRVGSATDVHMNRSQGVLKSDPH